MPGPGLLLEERCKLHLLCDLFTPTGREGQILSSLATCIQLCTQAVAQDNGQIQETEYDHCENGRNLLSYIRARSNYKLGQLGKLFFCTHTTPSFTSHQFVPSHRHTLMSIVRCLEVKTFGKNQDAAGSGTDDYSTVETSLQPSAGTAAESFDLLCSLPLLLSYCFSPYKREEGVSISTTNSQPVTTAPPQVFLASPGESLLFHHARAV